MLTAFIFFKLALFNSIEVKTDPHLEKDEKDDVHVHVEVADAIDAELEQLIQTNPSKGLTDAEVEERLAKFGPNGELYFLVKHACIPYCKVPQLSILDWVNYKSSPSTLGFKVKHLSYPVLLFPY